MGSALGAAKTAAMKIGCTVDEWIARRANGERWCTSCRAWWFAENMQPAPSRPDGIGLKCRACTAEMFAARKKCRTTQIGRTKCAQLLIDEMAKLGTEVTVSTAPPLVRGPYTTDSYVCPHGVDYWIEPTGEQIAHWVETRTP